MDRNQCVNLRQPRMNRSRSHHSTPISDDGQSNPMISIVCRVPLNIMVSAMQIISKHSIVRYPTQGGIDHGWSRKPVKIRRKSIANAPPIADRQQPLYRRRLASLSDSSRHRMSSSRTIGRGGGLVCFTLLRFVSCHFEAWHGRTYHRARGATDIPGPLTFRMIERVVSSRNSTRTWVTPPREPVDCC